MRRQTLVLLMLFVSATVLGTAYHQTMSAQLLGTGVTVDDGDFDYLQWPLDTYWQRQTFGPQAYMADATIRPVAKYAPAATATYTFRSGMRKQYEIFATWPTGIPVSVSLATAVPYRVLNSKGAIIATFMVNQKVAPRADMTIANLPFQSLGKIDARDVSFRVVIDSKAEGGIFVVADAIRAVEVGSYTPASRSSVSSGGFSTSMSSPGSSQPSAGSFSSTMSSSSSSQSSVGTSSSVGSSVQSSVFSSVSSSMSVSSSSIGVQCVQDSDCGITECTVRQTADTCVLECPVYICHTNQCIARIKNLPCPNQCRASSSSVSSAGSSTSSVVAGSFTVVKDSTPVRTRQLLGGTLGDTALRLEFRASEVEPLDITMIPLALLQSPGLSVDRLELYRDGEVNPFAIATRATCGLLQEQGTYCASIPVGGFILPAGLSADVLVRPRMNTDTANAVSGERETIAMLTTMSVRGRGRVSQTNLSTSPTTDILSPPHVTVLSKLGSDTLVTAITNANPDPNGFNIPTGVNAIGQFRFTAAPHQNSRNGLNKWVLNGVIFNVTSANVMVNANTLYVYNKADSNVKKKCFAMDLTGTVLQGGITGAFHAYCSQLASTGSNVLTAIDAGSDQTFVLEMEVTNPKINAANTSLLQVSLQNFTDSQLTTFTPSGSHLEWMDKDSGDAPLFRWIEFPDTVVQSTAYQG